MTTELTIENSMIAAGLTKLQELEHDEETGEDSYPALAVDFIATYLEGHTS